MDFRPLFGPNLDPKWLHFWLVLAPFLAPLRGAILSENTRKTNVFHCFGAPKRLTFGAPFGLNSGSILAPIWSPFGAPFGPGPNLSFGIVFRPARPSLGAEVRKLSPESYLLKNYLENFLINFLRKFSPEKIF